MAGDRSFPPAESDQGAWAVLDALPDPALLVGQARRILMANPSANELFGAQVTGQSVMSYLRQPEATAALEKGFAVLDGAPPPATRRGRGRSTSCTCG